MSGNIELPEEHAQPIPPTLRQAPEVQEEWEEVEPITASVSIEQTTRELIQRVLEQCGGNRKEAAEQLGISERTLYRKIKEYDL